MLSKVKSMSLEGLNGYLIEIQTDISGGIPSFDIVGLPDIRVKEAKERVKAAIKNSRMEFPSRKIVVNLAPADKKKEGTFFDLSIAVGILISIGEISQIDINEFSNTIFIGELSLDGRINKINGILPMCIEAVKLGIKRVVVPEANSLEASIVKDLEIIPVNNLIQVIDYIQGNTKIGITTSNENIDLKSLECYDIDFSEVKGQEEAKRALEIAATRFS